MHYLFISLYNVHFINLLTNVSFFSVPIIPEFLYAIRHQHDRFTTPRITSTTTTTLRTPFAFNETYYGDPAAPFDFIGEKNTS